MKALDYEGREIEVGDVIIHCVSAGRGQVLAKYEVLEIKDVSDPWYHRVQVKCKCISTKKYLRGDRPAYFEDTANRAYIIEKAKK